MTLIVKSLIGQMHESFI